MAALVPTTTTVVVVVVMMMAAAEVVPHGARPERPQKPSAAPRAR
jgi:hypothetical protein